MRSIQQRQWSFVEYLPEDGRKMLKRVKGLPDVCVLQYVITVQQLEYTVHGDDHHFL